MLSISATKRLAVGPSDCRGFRMIVAGELLHSIARLSLGGQLSKHVVTGGLFRYQMSYDISTDRA